MRAGADAFRNALDAPCHQSHLAHDRRSHLAPCHQSHLAHDRRNHLAPCHQSHLAHDRRNHLDRNAATCPRLVSAIRHGLAFHPYSHQIQVRVPQTVLDQAGHRQTDHQGHVALLQGVQIHDHPREHRSRVGRVVPRQVARIPFPLHDHRADRRSHRVHDHQSFRGQRDDLLPPPCFAAHCDLICHSRRDRVFPGFAACVPAVLPCLVAHLCCHRRTLAVG